MKMVLYAALSMVLTSFFAAFPQDDTMSLGQWKKTLAANDEFLHALEVMDKNLLENAKALIHNLQTKKTVFLEMAKYHADEIGRGLASSENYLHKLQKATDIALDEIQIAFLAELHQHYRKAMEEHRALQAELIKASPATSVLIMKATNIYSEISKAESEQIELELKMEIKKPGLPLRNK